MFLLAIIPGFGRSEIVVIYPNVWICMDVYRFVCTFIEMFGFLVEDRMDVDMDGMIGGKIGDG